MRDTGTFIYIENNSYVVKFGYDPNIVALLKSGIPSTGRAWDNNRKCWIISADYRKQAENALGMSFPIITPAKPVTTVKLLAVHYLGQCKERAPGDISAMGLLADKSWGAVFPVASLVGWFENPQEVNTPSAGALTLYGILGAKQGDDEAAIKKAYLRMMKQWHPDLCREPDAHKMTLRIREAYDILSVPRSRGRYDAGLALAASIGDNSRTPAVSDVAIYRSPLRCGHILAEGVTSLGRFVVSKILGWEDITDAHGRVMVASWVMGDKEPIISWA